MVEHTTIIYARYSFLALDQRKTTYSKKLRMIFYQHCSKVKDVDLETVLKGLLVIVQEIIDLEIIFNTEVVKT